MKTKHSPLPWTASYGKGYGKTTLYAGEVVVGTMTMIGESDDRITLAEANAAFAARAATAFDDLVAAADEALNVLIGCCIPMHGADDRNAILSVQQQLRAALAKARAEARDAEA